MDVYALLVALVLVTALLMHGTREHNKAYVITACLLLFTVFGLRNTYIIGVDTTSSYLHLFERMANYSWWGVIDASDGYNTGFYLFNKLIYEVTGGNYQLFISLIAVFVTFCLGHFVYRYSPSPVQSFLYHFGLLFFTFHFSALKQSIAMSILLLAFDEIIRQRSGRFILLIVLASTFHFPALVFLPAYWMAQHFPGRRFLMMLVIALAVTFLLREQIVNLMYRVYGDEASFESEGVIFFRTKSIVMLVIVAAALVLRKPDPEDFLYNTLLEFMGVAIVFQTFCGYSNIFERLADYYFQFSIVFIPMVFDRSVERSLLKRTKLLELAYSLAPIVFCGYAVYRFLQIVRSDVMLYPYRFFFQGK